MSKDEKKVERPLPVMDEKLISDRFQFFIRAAEHHYGDDPKIMQLEADGQFVRTLPEYREMLMEVLFHQTSPKEEFWNYCMKQLIQSKDPALYAYMLKAAGSKHIVEEIRDICIDKIVCSAIVWPEMWRSILQQYELLLPIFTLLSPEHIFFKTCLGAIMNTVVEQKDKEQTKNPGFHKFCRELETSISRHLVLPEVIESESLKDFLLEANSKIPPGQSFDPRRKLL